MMTSQYEQAPGPLELMESARTKYTLAQARVRRGPPELALLSVHGSLEDVLRAHGLRLGLPEAYEPFPQLLEALTTIPERALSTAEAEGIRRMHRLRARVAHGEQIAVASETLDAYHRLAARLLPRYGVVVVGPQAMEHEGEARGEGSGQARRGDTTAIIRRDLPETRRRGDTAVLDRNMAAGGPRRERTVYPDDRPARYGGRVLPSAATRDLPLAREMMSRPRRSGLDGQVADFWERSQRWLLPVIIVVSMFLVGLVISTSLGQLRARPVAPTAALALTPIAQGAPTAAGQAQGGAAPQVATADPGAATVAPGAATAAPQPVPGGFAIGQTVLVRADAEALNVRAQPGTAPENPVQGTFGPGTALQIIGGPIEADGLVWWKVRAANVEGWSAGEWLVVP